jgi:hypothetical protein
MPHPGFAMRGTYAHVAQGGIPPLQPGPPRTIQEQQHGLSAERGGGHYDGANYASPRMQREQGAPGGQYFGQGPRDSREVPVHSVPGSPRASYAEAVAVRDPLRDGSIAGRVGGAPSQYEQGGQPYADEAALRQRRPDSARPDSARSVKRDDAGAGKSLTRSESNQSLGGTRGVLSTFVTSIGARLGFGARSGAEDSIEAASTRGRDDNAAIFGQESERGYATERKDEDSNGRPGRDASVSQPRSHGHA